MSFQSGRFGQFLGLALVGGSFRPIFRVRVWFGDRVLNSHAKVFQPHKFLHLTDPFNRLCVKAVTEPDSAESTEITERSEPKLRKTADNYDLPIPIFSSVTSSI